jgi:hypothetical protein
MLPGVEAVVDRIARRRRARWFAHHMAGDTAEYRPVEQFTRWTIQSRMSILRLLHRTRAGRRADLENVDSERAHHRSSLAPHGVAGVAVPAVAAASAAAASAASRASLSSFSFFRILTRWRASRS